MGNKAVVLYYDLERGNGCKRQVKNSEAMRNAIPDGLELTLVSVYRADDFSGSQGAISLLTDDSMESFPYSAVIINGQSPHADDVLAAAQLGLESHGLPQSRIIYIYNGRLAEERADGVNYARARGGNGHLLPQDAVELMRVLVSSVQRGVQ